LALRGCLPLVTPMRFIHLLMRTLSHGHGGTSAEPATSSLHNFSGIESRWIGHLGVRHLPQAVPACKVPAERRNSPVLGVEDRSLVISTLEPTSQFQVLLVMVCDRGTAQESRLGTCWRFLTCLDLVSSRLLQQRVETG
jgi:hypothetical protein